MYRERIAWIIVEDDYENVERDNVHTDLHSEFVIINLIKRHFMKL